MEIVGILLQTDTVKERFLALRVLAPGPLVLWGELKPGTTLGNGAHYFEAGLAAGQFITRRI